VTDGFLAGDGFTIFDCGALIGSTSVVLLGPSCGLDPNVCFPHLALSHASFLLLSGTHSLVITVQPAQILGEGFLRVQAVPEPISTGLIAMTITIWIVGLRYRHGRQPELSEADIRVRQNSRLCLLQYLPQPRLHCLLRRTPAVAAEPGPHHAGRDFVRRERSQPRDGEPASPARCAHR
jgi:hypothetical protein